MIRLKSIFDYRAVIFDVDGTLYYQPRLRAIMGGLLLLHILKNPRSMDDLKIIKAFRKYREENQKHEGDLATYQYQVVAEALSVKVEAVRKVVERWIYREPLPYLYSCRDEKLLKIALAIKSRGATVIAYSDYPAAEKLAALGIKMDFVFSATDREINCLKPDPKGLTAILSTLHFSPTECLFIGDRDEKDGLCARSAGMDYLILPTSRSSRRQLYSRPPFSPEPVS